MTAPATIELELASAPENVSLVRAGLKGFGTVLDLDPELLDDLQMVASEACNNVVRHAYEDAAGPLRFRASAGSDGVELVVRDRGAGIGAELGAGIDAEPDDDEQAGLGLAVIDALADRAALEQLPNGGTEVCMSFARPIASLEGNDAVLGDASDPSAPSEPETALSGRVTAPSVAFAGHVVATVSPVDLLPGILGRLVRSIAAQARFSVERFPDIRVVVDSLVSHAQRWATDGRICVALDSDTRRLDFRVSPLVRCASGLEGLSCSETLRPRLCELVDEVQFVPSMHAEVMSLSFTEGGLAQAI